MIELLAFTREGVAHTKLNDLYDIIKYTNNACRRVCEARNSFLRGEEELPL